MLVMVDYASWYPEASPLRSTHAKVLAEELMGGLFTGGVPKGDLNWSSNKFYEYHLEIFMGHAKNTPIENLILLSSDQWASRTFQQNVEGNVKYVSDRETKTKEYDQKVQSLYPRQKVLLLVMTPCVLYVCCLATT